MRAEVVMQIEWVAGWVGRMNGFELCDPLGWVAGYGARDCFLCLVERSTPFFGLDGHRQTGLPSSARTDSGARADHADGAAVDNPDYVGRRDGGDATAPAAGAPGLITNPSLHSNIQ